MKFLPAIKKLPKPGRVRTNADRRFGTGLWRHNRDRFARAVDRYYTTAVAIHEALDSGSGKDAKADPANQANATDQANAAEIIIQGTTRLNELAETVDEVTADLHARHPVVGQVVPALTRQFIMETPELLTKASAKVAEAVLAASMARTELATGRPITSSARACQQFIDDATHLIERAQTILRPKDSA